MKRIPESYKSGPVDSEAEPAPLDETRRHDLGPLDTEVQCREALRELGLAIMNAGNAVMELEKPTGLGDTRFELTDEQRARIEVRKDHLRTLHELRRGVRQRLQDIMDIPNDTWKAALMKAVREIVPEQRDAIIARAKEIEEEYKQRRAVTMSVGSAIGVRGTSGGARRREGE